MAKVKDFKPATRNANGHTARGLGVIAASMGKDGYGDPMLAAADGEMISGSARLETAAQVFGVDVEPLIVHSDGTRPVIHVRDDIPNAQDQRAVRLALAANRAAELDLAWDVEVLAGLDAATLDGLWTAAELSSLGDYENPLLRETTEGIRPRPMFRVLVSVPIDEVIDLKDALEGLRAIPGAEVLYGANG
jgi:hypothetical protein